MFFPVVATALLSLVGITHAVDTKRELCDLAGPWLPPSAAGAPWLSTPIEQHWCEAGYTSGDILTGIKIWRADWQIHALALRWGSHDYGIIYGHAVDPNKPDATAEWDPSTKVNIRLWNNKPDDGDPIDALGRIRVEIEGKDPVEVKAKKVGDEIPISTGAGLILATTGVSGEWISTIQFHYLESKIVDASLTSIDFEDALNKYNDKNKKPEDRGLIPAVMVDLYITNESPIGGENQTFTMTPSIERATSRSVTTTMSHSIGTTIGFKVSTEVGLPEVAKVTTEWSAELRYDFTHMKAEGKTETDTFKFPWTHGVVAQGIAPQRAAHCKATATMGTFDSDYKGTMTVKLDNGKTFSYNDAGTYRSINYAGGQSGCKIMPLSEVPAGVQMIPAESVTAGAPVPEPTAMLAKDKRAMQFRA